MNEILSRIETIAGKVFKAEGLTLAASAKLDEIAGWGSLSHVLFMEAIEKEFACTFSFHEMLDFTTIDEICVAVKSKLSE